MTKVKLWRLTTALPLPEHGLSRVLHVLTTCLSVLVRALMFWEVQNFLPRPTPLRSFPTSSRVYNAAVARLQREQHRLFHVGPRFDVFWPWLSCQVLSDQGFMLWVYGHCQYLHSYTQCGDQLQTSDVIHNELWNFDPTSLQCLTRVNNGQRVCVQLRYPTICSFYFSLVSVLHLSRRRLWLILLCTTW